MYKQSHRNVNMDLAIGFIQDLGVHSLMRIFQAARQALSRNERLNLKVKGSVFTPEPRTGDYESTTILLGFPRSTPTGSNNVHAIATTAMRTRFDQGRDSESASPAVRIQGDKGEMQVCGPIYLPQRYRILYVASSNPTEIHHSNFTGRTHGMNWEDECRGRIVAFLLIESASNRTFCWG